MDYILEINNISGHVDCNSDRARFHSTLDDFSIKLFQGVNVIHGEIDSGGWEISYILGSSNEAFEENIFLYSYDDINCMYKGEKSELGKIREKSFYVDRLYVDKLLTVKEIIENNLQQRNSDLTLNDITNLFHLSQDRLNRTVLQSGNESLVQIAAIGYSMGKEIFCFPWYSKRTVDYFHGYITLVFDVLSELNTTVIFPSSYSFNGPAT